MIGPVVVAGASGFVGGRLVPALRAAGHAVRCGSRAPGRAPDLGAPWVRLDVEDAGSLDAALAGARAYVHLVHHMGADDDDLVAHEAAVADRVAASCARAGVDRIVYLGAPVPPGTLSPHLRARAVTGERLRAGSVPVFELRASMIVGTGSESWLIVRDLAKRLPVMVLPTWLRSRTQPVWIGDVVAALVGALTLPLDAAGVHDVPGPEVLSAEQILVRTAAVVGIRPVMVHVPVLTPALSMSWIRLVTRADRHIAHQLVQGLTGDLLMDPEGIFARLPGVPRTPFDEAARRALAEEDRPPGGGAAWEWVAARLGRPASR